MSLQDKAQIKHKPFFTTLGGGGELSKYQIVYWKDNLLYTGLYYLNLKKFKL